MERPGQLLNYIRTQLGAMNPSQRVAIGLCAAMVVGSVLWLLQWSTSPEMVPVVAHELTFDELNAAEDSLQAGGIPFDLRGNRIYVRSLDRHNALRILYTAKALPEGSLFDMQAIVTDDNPFQSPEARAFAQNYAKGNEVAKIIATYPNVQKASVLINPRTKRRIEPRRRLKVNDHSPSVSSRTTSRWVSRTPTEPATGLSVDGAGPLNGRAN